MNGYDVIGDVHGHADRLEGLLRQLGYRQGVQDAAWRHPSDRRAVFVGDLIDRGRQQLRVLRIVRAMVEAGSAFVVMGNHEFNAVAYATVDPLGLDYCRPHTEKNDKQHADFLAEIRFDTPLHRELIAWFMTIPLWLELDGLRIVHACWSEDDMKHLEPQLGTDRTLTKGVVIDGSTKGHRTYCAIENVLKGPEVDMADHYYLDKDGNRRDRARARWWAPSARTLRAIAEIPSGTTLYDADDRVVTDLPDVEPESAVPRYDGRKPVLYGHYWRSGNRVVDPNRMTACVDYSAGRGEPLVAYCWNEGDTDLDPVNLQAF